MTPGRGGIFYEKESISLAAYLLLLGLLSYVEKGAQSPQITSFPDALWYSLVTMTTVGYGDVVPQTGLGRVIGCVFLLVSLGILTSLLSLAYSLVVGQLIPKLWLWFRRSKPWHVFPLTNEESIAMAKALKEESQDSVAIFLQSGETADISISLSPRQILEAAGASVSFYYLGDTTPEICRRGMDAYRSQLPERRDFFRELDLREYSKAGSGQADSSATDRLQHPS